MRGSPVQGRHRGATRLVQKSRNVWKTRVATSNVGTLTGRSYELAEALERRRIDFCAVQETRWSCCKSRDIGHGFKAVLCGGPKTTNGAGIIVSERFRDSIVGVERFDDRLMKIIVVIECQKYHFFSAYAPQAGCSEQTKDKFWNLLDEKTAEVPLQEALVVAGDLNGHVGATKDGYSCHGGFGYGSRNTDGERILEYADSHNLVIVNTKFRKRDSHLITFYSGENRTQIDFVLVRHRDQGLVTDAKTVPYETVATQHRPLICTLRIAPPKPKVAERCGPARIKWWRLKGKKKRNRPSSPAFYYQR
nr:Endonuclease exonuclease phosphatase domain containing protein [Haemonchus contortus]